jgi:broad specificity phosphatase PhoE
MKPENIVLVRHGQSEGNINHDMYADTPDYTLRLTPMGREQTAAIGKELADLLGDTTVQFYGSPFWRTRETYKEIAKFFPNSGYYEDPRLREQEWGNYRESEETKKIESEREGYGHFYYRFPDGESCADVYDRVSTFFSTLHRDFEKPHFPKNVIIVSHGMTIRVFLMRFFHLSVEAFEEMANPRNCEYFVLKLNRETGKYALITMPRKHEVKHDYQFNWNTA